jgi:hypothetical protein
MMDKKSEVVGTIDFTAEQKAKLAKLIPGANIPGVKIEALSSEDAKKMGLSASHRAVMFW